MKTIIGEQDFIKNLDDWLFKNTQTSAKWISSNKAGIPQMFRNYGDWLYRGMFIELDLLMEIQSKGIHLGLKTKKSPKNSQLMQMLVAAWQRVQHESSSRKRYHLQNKFWISITLQCSWEVIN